MSADLIGDDACREAFNKARQQRFSVHGLDVVCEPDIFRAGYAAGRDSEIAKRDARMAELEKELQAGATAVENCELFRAELAAIKAQKPVQVDYVAVMRADGDGGLEVDWLLEGGTAELMNGMYLCCVGGGTLLFEEGSGHLYAAPVSEAKAQGVVLTDEELCSIRNQVACNEVRRDDDSRTICVKHGRALEAAVLARLNAAPVQQVSVPVEIGEVSVAINNGSKQFVFDEYSAAYALPVGTHYLYAAPAAPAADAGLVELECSDCNGSEWQTLPDEEGVLRDMKCHCALAAHRSKGVV